MNHEIIWMLHSYRSCKIIAQPIRRTVHIFFCVRAKVDSIYVCVCVWLPRIVGAIHMIPYCTYTIYKYPITSDKFMG